MHLRIPHELLTKLSRHALMSYIAIARFGWTENGCYASRQMMFDEIEGLSMRDLRVGIPELVALGIVTATTRTGQPTIYHIVDEPVAEDGDVELESVEPTTRIPELTVIEHAQPKQRSSSARVELENMKASHPEYVAVVKNCWLPHRQLQPSQRKPRAKLEMLQTIKRLVETDGRPLAEVEQVVTYVATKWQKYCASPTSLRKRTRAGDQTKYEAALTQMGAIEIDDNSAARDESVTALLAGIR